MFYADVLLCWVRELILYCIVCQKELHKYSTILYVQVRNRNNITLLQ